MIPWDKAAGVGQFGSGFCILFSPGCIAIIAYCLKRMPRFWNGSGATADRESKKRFATLLTFILDSTCFLKNK